MAEKGPILPCLLLNNFNNFAVDLRIVYLLVCVPAYTAVL